MKTVNTTIAGLALAVILVLAAGAPANAIPKLQLDIAGGTYDYSTQTIVASESAFTLFAYLVPDSRYNTLSDDYYISASIVPNVGPDDANLGYFTFDKLGDAAPATTVDVTADMSYGYPPLEQAISQNGWMAWDSGDLSPHGVFPTFFSEFGFKFDSANKVRQYNTQDRAQSGGSIDLSYYSGTSKMYYAAFSVDISGLDPGYAIHFDLYNTKIKGCIDVDITSFAPFSHDAESGYNEPPSVPEPSTIALTAIGAAAAGLYLRRRKG